MVTGVLSSQRKSLREGLRLTRAFLRRSVERKAQALRQEAIARGRGLISVPEDEGYVRFSAVELVAGRNTIQQLGDLAKSWTSDRDRVSFEKKFPINLMRGEDLLAYGDILKLALHDEVLSSITLYFDQVPRLFNLNMWWSPPDREIDPTSSQSYHYDHRDSRQAKVFINLRDVTEDSGPLHFIPAKECLKVDARVGYSQGRYTDEEVYSCVPESGVVTAKGEAGTAYIVDTARCLHYGSRGNKRDRLILMASYARANSVKPGAGCRTLDPVRRRLAEELYANDPVRSFVVNVPR